MKNWQLKLCITIILLALKLDGIIQISWLIVFAPIWFNCLIEMIITIIAFIIMQVQELKRERKHKFVPQGKRIVWDAKTQTMYGSPESEADANETVD